MTLRRFKNTAAILDAILNCWVTVACWKGCPPRSCCCGSKEQPFTADRVCFHKIGCFAPRYFIKLPLSYGMSPAIWDHSVTCHQTHVNTPHQAGRSQFTYHGGTEGWLDLDGWLHTKMVYLSAEVTHPCSNWAWYWLTALTTRPCWHIQVKLSYLLTLKVLSLCYLEHHCWTMNHQSRFSVPSFSVFLQWQTGTVINKLNYIHLVM